MESQVALIQAKHIPTERIQLRVAAEAQARQHLLKFLVEPTQEHLKAMLVEADYDRNKAGTKVQDRFGLAFRGSNGNGLLSHVQEVVTWVRQLWETPESDCPELMEQFLKDGSIPGAGPAFVSLILYLRNPEAFNLWLGSMVKGLELVDGKAYGGKKTADLYKRYNQAANEFRRKYQLEPQAMDIVLVVLNEANKKKDLESGDSELKGEIGITAHGNSGPFSAECFTLLAGLKETPTYAFYQAHKTALQNLVQTPFQRLLREVVKRLPTAMLPHLETEKRLFGRIPKNDYGQGGANSFYWGALYPKGGKRIGDAQLYMLINSTALKIGFWLPDEQTEAVKRFVEQAPLHVEQLVELVGEVATAPDLGFGIDGQDRAIAGLTAAEWLKNPKAHGLRVELLLPAEVTQSLTEEDLIARVARLFEDLFPLFQLAEGLELPSILDPEADEDLLGLNPPYSIATCAADTMLGIELLERWLRAIERKKQAVLYGPPGTGKTFVARRLARHLVQDSDGLIELVQFHPAYSYEDFIQGIRPESQPDGGLSYPTVPGRFMQFCELAAKRKGPCVLILDEMNRANLSQVFGELMYLLEYRNENIQLAGGNLLRIPNNVRVLGTMNTADRSIALVDHALRRRFAFLQLRPDYDLLKRYQEDYGFNADGLVTVLQQINNSIQDPHFELGITYFLRKELGKELKDIWEMEIEPYLEEFFYDQQHTAENFRWAKVQNQVLPS